jgi:large subunit ribosomal protein L31e
MERTYTIPLRKGWLKASKYRRAKKAVNTLREFLVKHMKSEDVRLMPELNLEIWKHGMRNPPSRVKVNVSKDDKGVVKAQLFGESMAQEVKEEKKGIVKKLAEKMTGKESKPAETPKAAAKPVTAEAPKPAAAKPAEPKKAPAKKVEPA